MKENLLQFVWKQKLFATKLLTGTNGELITILSSGLENLNTGPDFLNAKVEINNQLWFGNVEIHLKSSDWYVHKHETDQNYDSVILHVVWENDVNIYRKSNEVLVTIELKSIIKPAVLTNYMQLFNTPKNWINCEKDIVSIESFIFQNWLERLYFQRLENKISSFETIFKQTTNNWENTLFILLAKNFGLKINGEAFKNFAESFDFSIVRKVCSNEFAIEALFFGQAGLLEKNLDSEYFIQLKKEYDYLKVKFNCKPILGNQIQFFRLHPNNFPTIRISQLAQLYFKHQNLFSKLMTTNSMDEVYSLFEISTSIYWETHYTFDKESKKCTKKVTKSFINLLLVNTIIPLKFMYLKSMGDLNYTSVIEIIEQIKPESNSIIEKFKEFKIPCQNAMQSQALIQLKNEYCQKQLCLQCVVGNELLKN